MKIRKLTCIVCPKGCDLTVTLTDEGAVERVEGHSCPRGKKYAENECLCPKRTVTTTVATEDGGVIPVKTSDSVPKSMVFEVMEAVSHVVAPNDAVIGQILVKNIANSGADLVVAGKK